MAESMRTTCVAVSPLCITESTSVHLLEPVSNEYSPSFATAYSVPFSCAVPDSDGDDGSPSDKP